jgi:hypothetical protein
MKDKKATRTLLDEPADLEAFAAHLMRTRYSPAFAYFRESIRLLELEEKAITEAASMRHSRD